LSQSLMVLSGEPLASMLLESKATAQTWPAWPVRLFNWEPEFLSQILTLLLLEPLASKRFLSLLIVNFVGVVRFVTLIITKKFKGLIV
jgi:hypothetical protein